MHLILGIIDGKYTMGMQPFNVNEDDGNCAIDWQNWIRSFELFLDVNEIEKSEKKRDWLLHFAGPKVQEIYFNLPPDEIDEVETDISINPNDTNGDNTNVAGEGIKSKQVDPYQEVVNKLQKYFAPKTNETFERHVFRQMRQKPDEKIDRFMLRLRTQAKRCGFTDQSDQNLRDQLIVGCKSTQLRRKMLSRDNESLDTFIFTARIMESVAEQEKMFKGEEKENPVTDSLNVNKIDTSHRDSQWKPRAKGREYTNNECSRCGSKGHKSNFEKCPAKGKTCNKCGKPDHFSRKCFTRTPMKRKNEEDRNKSEPPTKIKPEAVRMINQSEKSKIEEMEDEYVFMIRTPKDANQIWCKIGGIETPAIVDSGSKYNIVDRDTWNDLKAKKVQVVSCNKTVDVSFRAYGGHNLKFLGMFEAILEVNNKQVTVKFYVADENGKVLLGYDTAMAMGILKIEYNVNNIELKTEPFNKMKNILVEIPIKEGARAVQQPYRRVPIPLEKAVDKKIDELLRHGIIEKVNSSNWISPLVIVPKPNSQDEIRICVDMKRVNEAVARENHPLPTIDDFLPELGTAKVFSKLDVSQAFHQVE